MLDQGYNILRKALNICEQPLRLTSRGLDGDGSA
jgi:hypothetical protein